MNRYLFSLIQEDALASRKMAFLAGPRQSGKTTLAQDILASRLETQHYRTWDDDEFQRLWVKNPKELLSQLEGAVGRRPLVVLDELHKYSRWKNSLKGFYDLLKDRVEILVTGSARLNVFRKSGDSLAGRYLLYRMHPFSAAEGEDIPKVPEGSWFEGASRALRFPVADLLELGGFPQPLLEGSSEKAKRWWRLYRDQIIREDLPHVKAFRDPGMISVLANLLTERSGGTLSIRSLQEDLKVSFATAKDWLQALETLYFGFRIYPYSKGVKGSLHKEPKFYLYHWAGALSEGAKLGNLVACHLLKSVEAWTDSAMGEFSLHYIRDKMKREVDFLVTRDQKPWLLLEVKSGEREPTPALKHYASVLKPKHVIQVGLGVRQERIVLLEDAMEIQLMSVERFLSRLV